MVLVAGRFFTLAVFSAPLPRRGRISPQPPSRREGGDFRLFYARGCAPCIPATEPARHWLDLPRGRAFFLARQPCLSLAFLPPSPQPPSRREGGESRLFHARGFAPCIPGAEPMVRRKSGRKWFPAGVLFGFRGRGAGGGSPRRNKLLVSPFPTGEGGWGDRGQESKPKAGFADGKQGKPPAGHHSGKVSRRPTGTSPRWARGSLPASVPLPAQTRGCKGRSPLHKKTKNLPLPAGKGGRGMGERT